MKSLDQIRNDLTTGRYELSVHAIFKSVERKIMYFEIEEAGTNVNIIEDYPNDKISPSCLLLGFTEAGRTLHLLVSRAELDYLKIITVYEPDADIFDNYVERK